MIKTPAETTYPERVLNYLEKKQNKLVSLETLYYKVWGLRPYGTFKNSVWNAISRARALCRDGEEILTVRNSGYIYRRS